MAHVTHEQIDQAAEQAAAAIEAEPATPSPDTYTTLAYGAQGECVTKLVDLLALLGYDTNNVVHGSPPLLDESVLVDVRAAQAALGVAEPELAEPSSIPVGVKGELVGQATWQALYDAAAAKLEAEQPAADAAPEGGASSA